MQVSLNLIENWLAEKTGILPERVGHELIRQAVVARMAENECEDVETYFSLLTSLDQEYDAFIAEVTVSETWFFRDEVPYQFLAEVVQQQWVQTKSLPCHVLSIPSSSGEEPYSIAIALSELGLDKKDYVIDAVDINREIIEKARKGIYRPHSFRGKDQKFLDRYFKKTEGEYHLIDAVKNRVNFSVGNVLQLDDLCIGRFYDIIFCRNLLIYYDHKTQLQVLKKIHHRLRPNGILFTGHAEANSSLNQYFTGVGPIGAFAFAKRNNVAEKFDAMPSRISNSNNKKVKNKKNRLENNVSLSLSDYQKRRYNEFRAPEMASKIEEVANSGDLGEANRLCQLVLSDSTDPEVYYVCGLVKEAEGASHRAEALFRMALKWNPEHYNALTHLAANLQSRGFSAEAKKIKQSVIRKFENNSDE